MVKIKITISRYQADKKLGEEYRQSSLCCSFTQFKKLKKDEEEAKTLTTSCTEKESMAIGSEKTIKKFKKKKLTPTNAGSFV